MIDHYLASLGLIASIVDASLACDVARDVKLSEHCQAESLFPREVATSVAVRSGDWSESSTWRPAMMPQAGARILIPEGVWVCLGDDYSGGGAVEWIRIEGELRLLADRDTGVKVGTMFVAEGGLFEIGTREERVAVGNCARVVFAARPPRESLVETDPQDLSGGLIVFGRWQVFGAQRTAFMMARTEVVRGSSEVSFDIAPAGWRVGDQLLFPGISAFVNEDELRSIAKISLDGRRFFLDAPLKFSHSAGKDRSVPIGNLTRNVLFESEVGSDAEQIHQRGHIMVMHSQTGTCLEGAGFHRLGRTRADRVHTRPMMGVDGVVVTGSDANPIGRYALHFHGRTGVSRRLAPQEVRDCVIMDSPKHGLVNHGGHVLAEGNVTYRIAGSHFFG